MSLKNKEQQRGSQGVNITQEPNRKEKQQSKICIRNGGWVAGRGNYD